MPNSALLGQNNNSCYLCCTTLSSLRMEKEKRSFYDYLILVTIIMACLFGIECYPLPFLIRSTLDPKPGCSSRWSFSCRPMDCTVMTVRRKKLWKKKKRRNANLGNCYAGYPNLIVRFSSSSLITRSRISNSNWMTERCYTFFRMGAIWSCSGKKWGSKSSKTSFPPFAPKSMPMKTSSDITGFHIKETIRINLSHS